MDYTNDQYVLMERLDSGLRFDKLKADEQDIIRYLDSIGLVQPRAQIAADYMELSQQGKCVLAARRDRISSLEQQTEQKAREHAEQKADQHSERAFQIFLVFLGYALGLLTDNLGPIIGFFARFFCDG